MLLTTIAITRWPIVCYEAVRLPILAAAWLLVKEITVEFPDTEKFYSSILCACKTYDYTYFLYFLRMKVVNELIKFVVKIKFPLFRTHNSYSCQGSNNIKRKLLHFFRQIREHCKTQRCNVLQVTLSNNVIGVCHAQVITA